MKGRRRRLEVARPPQAAPPGRKSFSEGVKDLHLKAKATTRPWLSYMCHVRLCVSLSSINSILGIHPAGRIDTDERDLTMVGIHAQEPPPLREPPRLEVGGVGVWVRETQRAII